MSARKPGKIKEEMEQLAKLAPEWMKKNIRKGNVYDQRSDD